MQFTVQIINYLTAAYLELCLDSVLEAAKGYEVEVLVSDNDSGDPDFPRLISKYPMVQFEINETNLGFGAAHNLLAKKASGEYLIILNPDILLPETFFKKLLLTVGSVSNFGAMGCRMIDGEGNFLKESKRGHPTLWNSFTYFSKLSALFPKSSLFAGYHLGRLPEKALSPVPVLSGACMVIPRITFLNEGGFDERFFMYGEDIELSERLLKRGLTNYYQGELTLLHFKRRSSAQKKQSINYFYNAMFVYLKLKLGLSGSGSRTTLSKYRTKKKEGTKTDVGPDSDLIDLTDPKGKEVEVGSGFGFAELIDLVESKKEDRVFITKKGVDWVLSPNGKKPRTKH